MTNASIIASLIVAASVAGVLGWLLRRWYARAIDLDSSAKGKAVSNSNAASLASGAAAMIGLPILLHYKNFGTRMVTPKEALEWIPLGLMVLAVITVLQGRDSKRAKVWLWLGIACCYLLAARMMWGSIYLKIGNIQWIYVAFLLVWGTAMAWCWFLRVIDRDKPKLLDGALQLILLLVIAVNLGLSGSLTYFAAAILMAVLSLASWIGGRHPSTMMSVMALAMLGLGPTFAETSWWVALLLLLATLSVGVISRCPAGSRRSVAVAIVSIALLSASAITGVAFRESMSSKNESKSGYEAYK